MAVYTEVSDGDLTAFVDQYDIGQIESCKGIAEGVENSNYLLRTSKGDFILTLYEKRVDPADLPFFLGLMDHLAAKGFPAPTPIHGKDDKPLRELCGRPAAICSFLSGMWPRQIEHAHCRAVGEAAAELHLSAAGFSITRANALSLDGWRDIAGATSARADEVSPGLREAIAAELIYLSDKWPDTLPEGVIHADMFPDNVFFLDGKLSGVIDFYFACNDALAYELAVCLNAWCFDNAGLFQPDRAKNLIAGYHAKRPLKSDEIKALPTLARGAALRFLLTRLYDWLNHPPGAFVSPKDPRDYLNRLSFFQSIDDPAQLGIAEETPANE